MLKSSLRNDALVVKVNRLIESKYKLSLREQLLVLAMISRVEKDDKDFMPIEFSVEELSDFVGVKKDGYYRALKKITKTLLTRTLNINKANGSLQIGWVSSADYFDKEGRIELSFDPKLKPYLLMFKKEFTKYQLRNVVSMRSVYAIRIYELCKQYESLEKRTITIKELKEMLGIDKVKYNRYNDFKRFVLETAKKEINAKTDIQIDYKEKKTGRKVTDLVFHIKKNTDNEYVKRVETAKLLQKTEAVKYSPELREFVEKTKEHYKSRDQFLEIIHNDRGGEYVVCINDKGQLYDGRFKEVYTPKKAKEIWERLYRLSRACQINCVNHLNPSKP